MSSGVGALTVTVLGTGTTALLVKSAWVRDWFYHGQHVTASAVYGRELVAASGDVAFYVVICVFFPLIGAVMPACSAGGQVSVTTPLTGRHGDPAGPARARASAGSAPTAEVPAEGGLS